MAFLDHREAFADLTTGVAEGIKSYFPIETKAGTVEITDVWVDDDDDVEDIEAQKLARLNGETWSTPLKGTLVRKDKDGKVLEKKRLKLANIPKATSRRSYIIKGDEYQVDSQWQLQPGVYTKRRQNGELESRINTPNKGHFDMTFDPNTKRFLIERGNSKTIPAYPILSLLGVGDDELEKAWGKEVLTANKEGRSVAGAFQAFAKADKKKFDTAEEAAQHVKDTLLSSELNPDSTELTLGKRFGHVNGEALKLTTRKMLRVQNGLEEEDERDSLLFKNLRTIGDIAKDSLQHWEVRKRVGDKLRRKIANPRLEKLTDIVGPGLFSSAISGLFSDNPLARSPSQVNPVEILGGAFQTTIMGPGGIQSEDSIRGASDAKMVSDSHFGYLDPIKTPEGPKTGVTLRLPIGVKKENNRPTIPLFNIKKGKMEYVEPTKFYKSKVVLSDQVDWNKQGLPVPRGKTVQASIEKNKFDDIDIRDADYVMPHTSQMFNVTSNLIPFLNNNSGNRASYASNQMEQAISVVGREAPLVQSSTGFNRDGAHTFEEFFGRHSAHLSSVDGVVQEVKNNQVVIKGADGKVVRTQLYNNFPLNDPKAMLNSNPLVKPGQQVKRGDTIADTNFTKEGRLATGTNLRVAYLPYKGYNFEDGIVVSESAAQKMASEHLHKKKLYAKMATPTDPATYKAFHSLAYTEDQYKNIADDGVVKVGTKVKPGDPLILSSQAYRGVAGTVSWGAVRKSLSHQQSDKSLKWSSDTAGEVVATHKDKEGNVHVHVKTLEPLQVGDKLSGRHGNKGIVTAVLPDKDMPHDKSKKPVQVLLNPSGVPGRMNVGQVLETAAAKIAEKTGKVYAVKNFAPGVDAIDVVKKELKKHGLSDTEELFDPKTGKSLGPVLTGPQYQLKLNHQIDKKVSARGGHTLEGSGRDNESYDLNLVPTGGAKSGGQSLGNLGLYALLAHGAKANIREIQTWKSQGPDRDGDWDDMHHTVWEAIQTGDPLPPPKKTFSFRKFEDTLKAAGIDVKRNGHRLQMQPLTDAQIAAMSKGAIKDPLAVLQDKLDSEGEFVPKRGGLFDPAVTGGARGRQWSHIELAEPMPNPVFEAPIQKLLGLNTKEYTAVATGAQAIKNGKLVPLDVDGAMTGGAALAHALSQIDVDKELAAAQRELAALGAQDVAFRSTPKLDKANKRVRYLQALKKAGVTPKDAYVLTKLPVLPPVMRQSRAMGDGNVKHSDMTVLYQRFGQTNGRLEAIKKDFGDMLPDASIAKARAEAYSGLKAIMGLNTEKERKQQEARGLLSQIHGTNPKSGMFQADLLNRRQDLSMRGTITPEPKLGLDEVALPTDKALTMFSPFVVRKLVENGTTTSVLEARKLLSAGGKKADPHVIRALDQVMAERPIMLKRDPSLHKYSVQGFRAKRAPGKAIQIHPLAVGGFGADFDGDTMAVFVPVSPEAIQEVEKMKPSNNLFADASGEVMFRPSLESNLGLFKLSMTGNATGKKFSSSLEAMNAAKDGKIGVTEVVNINGTKTTPGRLMLASAAPAAMQKELVSNLDFRMDKRGIGKVYTAAAKHERAKFPDIANNLMRMGFDAAYGIVGIPNPKTQGTAAAAEDEDSGKNKHLLVLGTHSLSLDDFTPDRAVRDPIVKKTNEQATKIRADKKLTKAQQEKKIAELWFTADETIQKEHWKKVSGGRNNLALMSEAGVKPSKDQYKQLTLAPMMLTDVQNRPITRPVTKSYSEGLDVAGYWTQMSGARRGSVMKVQEVQDPGFFTKQLMNTSMDVTVDTDDCGTRYGVALPVGANEIYDRELAKDVTVKGTTFKAGTLLDSNMVHAIRASDKNAQLVVRSPLKCEHSSGICKKCAGLSPDTGNYYDAGTNIGVLATHALGERTTQLTLKAFHGGGIAKRDPGISDAFERVSQILRMPSKIPNAASLAETSGTVESIKDDATGVAVTINGKKHHVSKDRYGVPLWKPADVGAGAKPWEPPKVGMKVKAGQSLSDPNRTKVNIRDLYKATKSIEAVQGQMVDELHGIFGSEGIRRQHVETVVRAATNLTRVTDPGSSGYVRGDYKALSKVKALNTDLAKQGKKPVAFQPVLKGIDALPLAIQEDWMAKLNHQDLRASIMDSAAIGAVADIHGNHPVPAMAYGAEIGLNSRTRPGDPRYSQIKPTRY